MPKYDAFLLVSFGGPEKRDDVLPFLENVLRGRNVPSERMLEVAKHYDRFDGKSPINDQNRQLIAALTAEFERHDLRLPIYWGNRNWHPLLPDTLSRMKEDGVKRAIALVTSAFSSYSGCRQYRENIADAQQLVGEGAPEVDKLRVFFNHPGFIETMAERVREAQRKFPDSRQGHVHLIYTAHSIPLAMAENCEYQKQLRESAALISDAVGLPNWDLVYQSRSGPPTQPWLEPDVCDHLTEHRNQGRSSDVIIVPLGFISDHMEVLFDLDEEAAARCRELGINMERAGTAGTHPRFVSMIRELVEEREGAGPIRPALGQLGASHDVCPEDCCKYSRPRRPA